VQGLGVLDVTVGFLDEELLVINSGDKIVVRSFYLGHAEIIPLDPVELNLETMLYDDTEASTQ